MPVGDAIVAVISDMQVGGTTAVCPPRWQLKTHFGNRIAANEDINTIGMVYYEVLRSGASKHFKEILEIEDTPIKEF